MKVTPWLCALSAALVLAGGARVGGGDPPPRSDEDLWVEEALAQMTLEEKVGQLIVPAAPGRFVGEDSEAFRAIERNLSRFHVGGYHLEGGEPMAVAQLVNRMQRLAQWPLLITADLEGGAGYQFPGATRLPRAMALGAAGSEELAYQAGRITAREGRAMGVGVNFYPVVDVNNNPANPIINIRAFGEDPAQVARLATAYIRGAQENGQLATAKHFPGHGDTSQDSHLELAVVDVGRERLEQIELPPFRAALAAGVEAVMTAHLQLPQFDAEEGLPVTLSPAVTTGLLREELGFQGLVFTDALTMRGIADHYTPEAVAVRAFAAGADVLLIPADVEKTVRALMAAVEAGTIPLARLDASVRRLLAAKARLGLHRQRLVDLERLADIVGAPEHQELAAAMMARAVTLVRDEKKVLPLRLGPEQRVLLLTLLDARAGPWEAPPSQAFRGVFRQRHANTVEIELDEQASPDALELAKKVATECDVVVANAFVRTAAYKGSIELGSLHLELLRVLATRQRPFILTAYGSPYLLSFVPGAPAYILTYEYYPEAERAAARAILGEQSFTGRLPVTLPEAYPRGHGLVTAGAARLSP